MKLRFLAIGGSLDARRRLEQQRSLTEGAGLLKLAEGHALSVWAMSGTPAIRCERREATLIGLLYERATDRRLETLPECEDLARYIIRECWGAYALLFAGNGGHGVLRDPSGAVPVYHGKAGDLQIYASDAALLALAWPGEFQPDLHFIRHWLNFPFLRGWRTGAAGVSELVPGTCRFASGSEDRTIQAWSPFDHQASDLAIRSFDDAAALLREQILRTVANLAAAAENRVLQLSGGLDSSIVAAALHQAGTSFRAVTFATGAADGDERRYARQVASYCGAELSELVEDDISLDLDRAPSDPFRPPPSPLLQPLHRLVSLHLALTGPELVLDGAGGDNVFAYLNTASPALDALRRAGIKTSMRALSDVAELHNCTLWTAALFALRKARRGAGIHWRVDRSFLTKEAALPAADIHPWLEAPPGLPPGSADHVQMIAGIHHFLFDPWPGASAVLHPLLAQPIVELCLRIPTWLWIRGGRDRAVARAAFNGLLPPSILERRGKGRLESMFLKGYMKARPKLERFLLDGRLAAEGIIDGAAIGAYLRQPDAPDDSAYIRLLEIAAAEQWLRSFRS